MKYFIYDVTSYKTKNDKGSEVYSYCADKYKHVILDSSDEIGNIINDIQDKVDELNKKYRRSRQSLRVNYREFKYCGYGTITVEWEDNNRNACCTMRVIAAKGILVDGVMKDND